MRGIVLLLSLVAAGVLAAAATAAAPSRTTYDGTVVDTVSGVCSFDVTINSAVRGTLTTFLDATGAVTWIAAHGTEQDTFDANGKTLVGDRYPTDFRFLFDAAGDETVTAAGPVAKVRLPDGALDLAAGHAVVSPTSGFSFSPDTGKQFDDAAFCAALA